MAIVAKWVVVLFGIVLIGMGLMMLFTPNKALHMLRKAGSNPFINYMELTVRMIPAAAMVIHADHSKYPELFTVFGWFMIATSIVLFFVPRRLHHGYARWWADRLKPSYIRMISVFSFLFGGAVIHSAI